jgi:hypothetical protein
MIARSLPTILALLLSGGLLAQYNDKGTFHIALGTTLAAHATEYDQTITIPFVNLPVRQTSTGGAATVTLPLEIHYGFAPLFSLGLYADPGRYVDSVATRENRIAMLGLQPRFYLVNKDRFAWMASLQLGFTRLVIDDVEALGRPKSTYGGGHFGLSTGVGFLFSESIGLQLHLRYLANNLPLREYEINGSAISMDLVDAELRANGVGLQASLNFRF